MNKLDQDILNLRKEKDILVSLDRLLINPDFKKVVLDEFLTKHPIDLLNGKGVLNLDPQTNLDIDRQLECVALFKMYLENQISKLADIDYRIAEAETLRDEQTRNT